MGQPPSGPGGGGKELAGERELLAAPAGVNRYTLERGEGWVLGSGSLKSGPAGRTHRDWVSSAGAMLIPPCSWRRVLNLHVAHTSQSVTIPPPEGEQGRGYADILGADLGAKRLLVGNWSRLNDFQSQLT